MICVKGILEYVSGDLRLYPYYDRHIIVLPPAFALRCRSYRRIAGRVPVDAYEQSMLHWHYVVLNSDGYPLSLGCGKNFNMRFFFNG